jgi:hypothetical protein
VNAETAEKVALLALHGAAPMQRSFAGCILWRIVLPQVVLTGYSGLASSAWFMAHLLHGERTYIPATWDEMSTDMQTLPWDKIHKFLGTTP